MNGQTDGTDGLTDGRADGSIDKRMDIKRIERLKLEDDISTFHLGILFSFRSPARNAAVSRSYVP